MQSSFRIVETQEVALYSEEIVFLELKWKNMLQ
jgi:hypothetical protein